MKRLSSFLLLVLCTVLLGVGVFFVIDGISPAVSDFLERNQERVYIDFLDIGQGDAMLVTFPNKQQMLVDCSIDARILEALGRHMPFYDHKIDYLVVTHPDKDHYGGCIDVLDRFDVGKIIWNGQDKLASEEWSLLKDRMIKEGAEIIVPPEVTELTIASTTIRFLFPDHAFDLLSRDGIVGLGDSNNGSIVLYLQYGETTALLMGDAERPLEEYLVDTYGTILDVDILKVGHHGSLTSSDQAFLDRVTPEHAVISSGRDNPYGHPSYRILRRLERAGAVIWRTDLVGDISLKTDGNIHHIMTR